MRINDNSSAAARQALDMISTRAAAASAAESAAAAALASRSEPIQAAGADSAPVMNSSDNQSSSTNQSTAQAQEHISNIEKNVFVSDEALHKSMEAANRAMFGSNRRLEYEVHEYTNTVMVRVMDIDTDEVLREVPSESRLDAIAKVWQMVGIIVDNVI